MTVKDLIAKLQNYEMNTPVVFGEDIQLDEVDDYSNASFCLTLDKEGNELFLEISSYSKES